MKTLVIDANCIAHIAKHSKKDLTYGEMETGVIFGFLEQIKILANKFNTNKFIFCWDSKKSKRKELYPDYKRHRHKDKTEIEQIEDNIAFKQFYDLRTAVLPKLGFKNIYIQTGYEADDLIAVTVKENRGSHNGEFDFIVVTNDDDLLQLLDHCDIYNPKTKKLESIATFSEEYGIPPNMWSAIKSLAGCTSDNVKGVEGVGIVKAIAYVTKKLKKGKIYDRIINEGPTISKRNAPLVHLPMAGTIIITPIENEVFNILDFIDVFEKYGLKSFLKKETLDQWRKLFNMED